MRRRIAVLLVLAMLVVGAVATLAAPASAAAGCQGFGRDTVAATAHQGPGSIAAIATTFRGALGHGAVDALKNSNCP
jgi:hypothetical protein